MSELPSELPKELDEQLSALVSDATRYHWFDQKLLQMLMNQLLNSPDAAAATTSWCDAMDAMEREKSGRIFLKRDLRSVVWKGIELSLRSAADLDTVASVMAPRVFSNIDCTNLLESFVYYMDRTGRKQECPKTTMIIVRFGLTWSYAQGVQRLGNALSTLGRSEEAKQVRSRIK